jgi:hypothetical protein
MWQKSEGRNLEGVNNMNKYITVLFLLCTTSISNAAINKCIVSGRAVYTEDSCPENISQSNELKIDAMGMGSQSMEPFSFKFKDHQGWYQLDSKNGYELTKYQEPYKDWNPAVSIFPLEGGPFQSPDDAFAHLLSILKSNNQDIASSHEASETKIAEYKAYYKQFQYTFTYDGVKYPITGDFWLIPRGENVVVLAVEIRPDDKLGSRNEALKIINSLEFVK